MRIRLLEQAEVDGALREAGYEYDLPDGVKGPHRVERISHDKIEVLNDSNRILGEHKDVPLYEVVG
jgi:hypothetical protein